MSLPGALIVITGPSGVGKGSLVRGLLDRNNDLWLSISATTRKPREGEKEGEHYFFLEREKFQKLSKEGGFVEWAEFAGNFYGTPRLQLKQKMKKGISVLLEIELEGARQVRKSFPEAFQIFLEPPSFEELEKRIRGRGSETEKSINNRLLRAEMELKAKEEFDAVVINDDLSDAIKKVERLIHHHENILTN